MHGNDRCESFARKKERERERGREGEREREGEGERREREREGGRFTYQSDDDVDLYILLPFIQAANQNAVRIFRHRGKEGRAALGDGEEAPRRGLANLPARVLVVAVVVEVVVVLVETIIV